MDEFIYDKKFFNYINIIKKANSNNTLAVFIGSGISKTSDSESCRLPDWTQLINSIKNELNKTNEQDFLKIAQLYYLSFGPYVYFNKIKSYFPDNIGPSIIHDMIFELNPQIIITTNWDNILDNAVRKHGYLYDIIASDNELTKSTLPKKIIKMHGDFIHDNFVFKEDDYLNYSDHFPLLENYIKGIISTHTVLFLGYSFSDIDLKHIVKWLQNRTACLPPMYFTAFEKDDSQIKYLENYNITTLLLEDEGIDLPENLFHKTKKLHYFLKTINQKDFILNPLSNDDIIEFIYNKLIIFNDLQCILFSHIQSVLTNCQIEFQHGLPILIFFNNILSYDNNKEIRVIYKRFIELLKTCCNNGNISCVNQKEKFEYILEIFFRAGIKGISLSDDMANNIKYFDLSKCFPNFKYEFAEKIINFNFNNEEPSNSIQKMSENAFLLYQQEKYEEIIPILDNLISNCRTNKLWTLQFISMLNKNIILRHLKYEHFDKNFENIKEYDLKSEYEKMPAEIRSIINLIYNFLEFNELYKYFFYIIKDLNKKEENINTIKKGGMVFGSDGGKNTFKQENMLHFVINNKIMLDNFSEYKDIHRKFLSILLIEQSLSNEININRIQLYTAIKYINNQDLINLLECCFTDSNNNITKRLIINNEDKKWLVEDIYNNLSEYYLSANFNSHLDNYLLNSLFILSIINLEKQSIDFIISKFISFIKRQKNSMDIYRGINTFLSIQFNLYATEVNPDYLFHIMEIVLRKIINREWSVLEYRSFTGGYLRNIFAYAQKQNAIFTDEKEIKLLISEITDFEEKEKMEIISSILLNIYCIGSDNVKEKIKIFVTGINNDIQIDNEQINNEITEKISLQQAENRIKLGSKIIFELNLILVKLKEPELSIINNIEKYLDQYEKGKYFDGYMDTVIDLIITIYKKWKYEDMKNLFTKAQEISENRKNRNNFI